MIAILTALFSIVLSISNPMPVEAGRGEVRVVSEGRYFTVKAFEGVEITALLQKLDYDYFLQVDTFLMDGQSLSDPSTMLGRNLDAIYREVETILGLEVSSFHGLIVICPDQEAVHEEFRKIYGMDFKERSFYIFDFNTIYISFQDLTLGMLGHEIAHAIISGYFVVPPPTKVQEVLAGYAEYSLRKVTTH